MTKPITPDEAENAKEIPDNVIQVINKLLKRNYRNGYATIKQSEIIREFKKTQGVNLFENWWLDFEPLYRNAGWEVIYESPGYNEDWYDPYYRFSRK